MASETILKKSNSLPKFLQDVFRCIDSKDFDGAKAFFEDDFRLYFAHYILSGVKQSLDFVGAFDKRLANYEHVMGDIYVGDQIVTFDGVLRVWLEDRVLIETPFWDKITINPSSGKISSAFALFSIAAVPERYWSDLNPNSK
jgi:hypothetical protein